MSAELEILKETRRLLDEKGWTQGAYARDNRGSCVEVESPAASCFCLSGALRRAHANLGYDSFSSYAANAATLYLAEAGAGRSIPAWNDAPSRTKDDVLKLVDRAITEAEKGVAA